MRDFSGGPVVKTLHSQYRGPGSIFGQGQSHMPHGVAQQKKKEKEINKCVCVTHASKFPLPTGSDSLSLSLSLSVFPHIYTNIHICIYI